MDRPVPTPVSFQLGEITVLRIKETLGRAFSPLFLLVKKREHFLTVGYSDDENHQQAMVFKVSKDDIRTVLVSLEARTGRRVEFQDDDARKGGKG